MFRKLFRFSSISNLNSFPKNSLEYNINLTLNNSRLLKYYKPNELSIPQLSLMLQKVNSNTTQLSEFNALFRSEEGVAFLNELISKHTSLSPQDKINLLEILADTTYSNRIKVINPNLLHEISLGIATEHDYMNKPEVFLKSYKTCAILGRANFFFETKVEELLNSELKISLEGFLNIIEGSILTCRPVSYKLCQVALNKIEKLNLEKESVQSLVKAFEVLNKLYHSYSFGKRAADRVKSLIIQNQLSLNTTDIITITEVYEEYLPDDKDLLNAAVNNILTYANTGTLYNKDNLKRIINSLNKIQIRVPTFRIDHNLAEALIEHVNKSNIKFKLLDLEAIFLIYKLSNSLNFLPSQIQSFMEEKFKKSPENEIVQFTIAIFLSKFNDSQMIELVYEYTKNLHKLRSFSIDTYIALYLLISRHNLIKDFQFFLNYIEDEITYRIKDEKSIRDTISVLLKFYFELKETKLAQILLTKIISVNRELFKSNKIYMNQCLSDMVSFPCNSNEIKTRWVEFLTENKKKIDTNALNLVIKNYNKDFHLEPMIDILYYGKVNDSLLAHCLKIRCPKPSHRLLSTTAKLLNNWNWLDNFEFHWPELTLFNQIFLKGYGNDFNLLFKTLNYANIIQDHPHKALVLLKIQAQYGEISKQIADLFIASKLDEVLGDSHCIAAIGTVYPKFLIEHSKAFKGLFSIENDSNLYEVTEKANFYMKLSNFIANKAPLNQIISYLTNLKSRPDLIIEFIQALNSSNNNYIYFNQLTSHIITLISASENPISDNTIATLLLTLQIKNYQNAEIILSLEQKFNFTLQDPDLIEFLIRAYIKTKRLNNFLDQLLTSSINQLSESTFINLTNLKSANKAIS